MAGAEGEADEALIPVLKIGNVSPANPLSTGCKVDKSWNSSARSRRSCGRVGGYFRGLLDVVGPVLDLPAFILPAEAGVVVVTAELGPGRPSGCETKMTPRWFTSNAIIGFDVYVANDAGGGQ